MNREMRAHVFFVYPNQKTDREKSGTRRHDDEDENGLAPEILRASPLPQPVLRRNEDCNPDENEKDECEYVPARNDAAGGASMAMQSDKSGGRDYKSNRKTMTSVRSAGELERAR